ncbi:MAG: Fic family protein [Akkermansiaceae bacterium]
MVRFLTIHPFQDGNDRLSRALNTLLLLQSEYEYVPYASIEQIIKENKDSYYRALRTTQSSFRAHQTGSLSSFLPADIIHAMRSFSSKGRRPSDHAG